MYAVVKQGGKQYGVKEGDVFKVDKLDEEIGKEIELKNVLMLGNKGDIQVGKPYLKDTSVLCRILRHKKGKKIIVFKHKRRKDYRKKQGHRQTLTELKVLNINKLDV